MSAEIFNLEDGDWVYEDPNSCYFAYCNDGSLYLEVSKRSVCLNVNEVRVLRNLLRKEFPDGTSETQE